MADKVKRKIRIVTLVCGSGLFIVSLLSVQYVQNVIINTPDTDLEVETLREETSEEEDVAVLDAYKESQEVSVMEESNTILPHDILPTSRIEPSSHDEQYVEYTTAIATLFWVGESAEEGNDFIANDKSAWDSFWELHFGGIDAPENRCGYKPCGFEPKENPFYIALPYNDIDTNGVRKESALSIPWAQEKEGSISIVKNAWVEIKYDDAVCYAQWQDVGPFESDDFEYVFGGGEPKNRFGVHAGIDLSPAVWDCLSLPTNVNVWWKFVKGSDVPFGPWKETVTTSDVRWSQ